MRALRDRLHEHLIAAVPGLRLNGHPEYRLPNTLHVSFPGVSGRALLAEAADVVAASVGSACHSEHDAVSGVLAAMGADAARAAGAVRLSVGRMSTPEELERAAMRPGGRLAAAAPAIASPTPCSTARLPGASWLQRSGHRGREVDGATAAAERRRYIELRPGLRENDEGRENPAAAEGARNIAAKAASDSAARACARHANRTILWRAPVNLDFIPQSARAAGLGALMKGAGKLTRFIPIPQPTLLVGPGSSGRLGQAVAGFGHAKILIVTDAIIAKLGLLKELTDALTAGGASSWSSTKSRRTRRSR